MSFKFGLPASDAIGLNLDLTDLSDALQKILSKYGLIVDQYYAFLDPMTGDIFINLTDNEQDFIDAIFTVDNDDIPGVIILDKNDRGVGWIDLEGIVPVINGRIDFGEGGWFRYSILTNLLKLGDVDFRKVKESKSKNVMRTITRIQEAYSVKGESKIAVVSHRARRQRLTTRQELGLASARRYAQLKSMKMRKSNKKDLGIKNLENEIKKYLGASNRG